MSERNDGPAVPNLAVIDTHAHVWDLSSGEYGWLDEERWATIRRNFTLDDLHAEMQSAGVDDVILVHAAATITETERLLTAAQQESWIAGVVSGGNLGDLDYVANVVGLSKSEHLVGFRHMLGWGPEYVHSLTDGRALEGAKMLGDTDLTIELHVTTPAEMEWALRLSEVVDGTPVVIDHLGKPPFSRNEPLPQEPWIALVRELGIHPSIFMKFSGWSSPPSDQVAASDVQPYFDHVLECFGSPRVMFGSNWPTALISANYSTVVRESLVVLDHLSTSERADVLAGAARTAFRLEGPSEDA